MSSHAPTRGRANGARGRGLQKWRVGHIRKGLISTQLPNTGVRAEVHLHARAGIT